MKRIHIRLGGILAALTGLAACEKTPGPIPDTAQDGIVLFQADGISAADFTTKTTAVDLASIQSDGFNVSATKGAGPEVSVWGSTAFAYNDGKWAGDKWWPVEDQGYHFYASNAALTNTGSGATVSASNATDVICAFLDNPTFRSVNTLSFQHIFARVGTVTVEERDDCTISPVQVSFTPRTGGTYDIRSGAGCVNGSRGWSNVTEGTVTVIADKVGDNDLNLYVVPGVYSVTAKWTATKGDYTASFEVTKDITFLAGKLNKLTCGLKGNVKGAVFTASVAPWADNTIEENFRTSPFVEETFAGLMMAPAPLCFDGSRFVIKDNDWNHDSYNSVYGLNEGSYYFSFIQLGQFFDARGTLAGGTGFSPSSGHIANDGSLVSYADYDDWRVPTQAEWIAITYGADRSGSSVSGIDDPDNYTTGCRRALIQLSGVTHATVNDPVGLLLMPDGLTLTGMTRTLTWNKNSTAGNTGVTAAQLQEYLDKGCVFLPASGYYRNNWLTPGVYGYLWSATQSHEASYGGYIYFNSNNIAPYDGNLKESCFYTVRLVRTATN